MGKNKFKIINKQEEIIGLNWIEKLNNNCQVEIESKIGIDNKRICELVNIYRATTILLDHFKKVNREK